MQASRNAAPRSPDSAPPLALRLPAPAMSKPAPKPTPAAAAASAAAAAAVTAAVAVDLKALAKTMKASMDTAAFGDALAAFSASALAASHATLTAAIEAAHRDAKRQAIMYTVLAFAGLCAAQTKQWSKAEDMYRKATGLQEDQFPAWKVRTRPAHRRTGALTRDCRPEAHRAVI